MAAQGAGTRWWRRGRDAAQSRARTAAAAAAGVFVELDALQRATALQVDAYAALRPGRDEGMADAWAAVRRDADAAATAYLGVPDQFDVEADLTERDAKLAEAGFRHAEATLRRALSAVQQFTAGQTARFEQVSTALQRLAAAGQEADRAIVAARDAVARAGAPAEEAAEALHRAEQARLVLAQGAGAHGLRAALAAAEAVLADAARARELAETLPEQRAEVQRGLTATRTRIDAVATRRDRLPETLSALRRSYVTASYADVEGRPADADRALQSARDWLGVAGREAAGQHWPRARTAIAEARRALDEAAAAVEALTQRLARLEELRRDPRTVVERTRFAVREAQRLFVFQGAKADQRFAPQLDSLVRRVATAEQGFAVPHPDFWRLDQDLARIRDETAEVVRRLRGGT